RPSQHPAVLDLKGVAPGQTPSGDEEADTEEVQDPGEVIDQSGAPGDEPGPQDQGTGDPVEEDPTLMDRPHPQGDKDHGDHEDVVDAQRLLEEVPGEVLAGQIAPGEGAEAEAEGDPRRHPGGTGLHGTAQGHRAPAGGPQVGGQQTG